jgi:uncharacterized delta-60 repeat protein
MPPDATDADAIDVVATDVNPIASDAPSADALTEDAARALCLGPELTVPGSLLAPSGWRPNASSFARLSTITLDAFGRTVLAGQYEHRSPDPPISAMLQRWNGGVADTTFGPNGSQLLQQFERSVLREESFTAVEVEAAGTILATGWGRVTEPTPHYAAMIVRFGNDGRADRAFGGTGMVDFRDMPYFAPRGMYADGLGALLVGSAAPDTLGEVGYAVRVLSNGGGDATFASSGLLEARDLATLAAPLRVGQDYLMATATMPARAPALLRITSAGGRATRFGPDGLAVFGGRGQTFPVALEPAREDGWLLLAGQLVDGTGVTGTPLVLRVRADGSLDPTFADRGALAIETGILRPDSSRQSLAVLCDGAFLVLREDRADGMMVSRYSAAGVLDTRFGDGGTVFLRAGGVSVRGVVAVESDPAVARVVIQAGDRRLGYFRIAQ